MFYKINPKYSLILKKNNELLIICRKNIKKIMVDYNDILKIENILYKNIFPYEDTKVFKTLLKNKVFINVNDMSFNQNTTSYLTTYTNKDIDFKKIYSKCVMIIGLGGIGVEIINHLVGAGIKNYVLVDYDKVEPSNFNRQYIYDQFDISKSKVEAIKQKIILKNPECNVVVYNKCIKTSKDIEEIMKCNVIDMVVCAADTPFLDIRLAILESCIKYSKPCIFGGVGIEIGQYGPTLLSKKSKQKYQRQLENIKKKVRGNNVNKASFGPTNSIVAAYIAMDIIMTLIHLNKNIVSLNSIHEINFKKRIDYEVKKF